MVIMRRDCGPMADAGREEPPPASRGRCRRLKRGRDYRESEARVQQVWRPEGGGGRAAAMVFVPLWP